METNEKNVRIHRAINLKEDELIVFLDFKNLYTVVLVKEAIEIAL